MKSTHELAAAGEFPGGIFWLPAETPDLPPVWGDAIACALGIRGDTPNDRALNTINTLSRRDAKLLVILDNVESWDRQSEPKPLPSGSNVTLLVTSRRGNLGGTRFRHFSLEFLGPAEARTLLTSLAGAHVGERPGLDELLDHLDGHALALELAGIYLREYPHVTPAVYLELLRAGSEPDAKAAPEARYERSVRQAFSVLWDRLDPAARAAWQLASQFAPEPVSVQLGQALSSAERSMDADHPARALIRARLAQVLFQTGEVMRARDEAREALRVVANQPIGSFFRKQVELITRRLLQTDEAT